MSFWELALIGIIALIVLGPERLPKAARTVGLWVGKAKQSFESIKTEIDRELKVKELQQQIQAQKDSLETDSDFASLKDELTQSANSISNTSRDLNRSIGDNSASSEDQPETPSTPESETQPSNISN